MKLCIFAAITAAFAAAKPKYNILFLMSDEMDGRLLDPTSPMWDAVEMPNLRKLAASGTNFVRNICNNPQCVPSRTSMFTGLHTHVQRAGWNNGQGIAHSPRDGTLDKQCVKLWSEAQCAQWKQESPVNTTLDQALEATGLNVSLFGKVDVGANILSYFPEANSNGFHSGPGPDILARSADIRKPTKPLPQDITNDNKPLGPFPNDWKVVDNAVKFLDDYDADESGPFFVYSSVIIPHPPFYTNETWLKRVNQSFMEQDELGVPVYDPRDTTHPYDSYMSQSKNGWVDFNRSTIQYVRGTYFGMNAMADYLHGRVLDALDRNGFANNTIIMFVADHGEMAMAARQVWKNSHREPSLRVPMIIAGPGIPSGLVVQNATSLLDVFPTLLEWAGASPPEWLQGYSLMDLLREQGVTGEQWATPPAQPGQPRLRGAPSDAAAPISHSGARPPFVLSQYSSNMGNDGAFCLYQPPYKLIDFGHSLPWFNASAYTPQLFNTETDPWEHHNLAAEKPEVVAQMQEAMATLVDAQSEDRARKISDRALFEEFIAKPAGSDEKLKERMGKSYKGFDEEDWKQLQAWRNAQL